ncbi:MAG: hypothetical protein M1401_11205 [Chloroflexi bacterium]|nr:hypothetical protein [Chloroflexota bacterium]MCL5109413.1 hypothetical protein [Chloroflexota bacterium]
MSAIAHDMRRLRAMAAFFTIVYLTYVFMYLAPTDRLRRWGARTWWRLFRLGPEWPT